MPRKAAARFSPVYLAGEDYLGSDANTLRTLGERMTVCRRNRNCEPRVAMRPADGNKRIEFSYAILYSRSVKKSGVS